MGGRTERGNLQERKRVCLFVLPTPPSVRPPARPVDAYSSITWRGTSGVH